MDYGISSLNQYSIFISNDVNEINVCRLIEEFQKIGHSQSNQCPNYYRYWNCKLVMYNISKMITLLQFKLLRYVISQICIFLHSYDSFA